MSWVFGSTLGLQQQAAAPRPARTHTTAVAVFAQPAAPAATTPAARVLQQRPVKQQQQQARRQHCLLVKARGASPSPAAAVDSDATVEEIMNPHPLLLQSSMSIKDAVHKMLELNVAGAPVVDDAGGVVGVLTESDLIWKGAGKPEDHFIIPPVFIGALDAFVFLRDNKAFENETHKILAKTVAEAMVGKDKVVTVGPAAPLSEAAQLMVHHDINLLPVVEGPGRTVVGILTRHDILRGMYASKSPLL